MPIVTDRLLEIAETDPGRELVFDELDGRQSYAQIAEKVDHLIGGLRSLDIGPGDVVIVQLPNWSAFLVVHLALSAIGAITATVPIVYRTRELDHVLRSTSAKALVVPSGIATMTMWRWPRR